MAKIYLLYILLFSKGTFDSLLNSKHESKDFYNATTDFHFNVLRSIEIFY